MISRLAVALACLSFLAGWPRQLVADVAEISSQVDELLQAAWESQGIEPALPADDATFLRRAYLDLTGVVPPVARVREFTADADVDKRSQLDVDKRSQLDVDKRSQLDVDKRSQLDVDKRSQLIDQLLDSPRHATHLANTWRHILLPNGFTADGRQGAAQMQEWLRRRFADNVRYDRMVGDFLTVTGSLETGPILFYQALEVQPEKLAGSTARSFLGLRIECAQCHDHPFDDWLQEDFWGYAAFFAQVSGSDYMRDGSFQLRDVGRGEVTIPEGDQPIRPRYLGGDVASDTHRDSRRLKLSIWMASRDNAYLAKATVNRVWWVLFGRGLTEPVDDMGPHNPPMHPEVLEALANFFIDSGYDLHELFRAIANTRAYQLAGSPDDSVTEQFAAMATKSMTADQLFDSVARACQLPVSLSGAAFSNPLLNPRRNEFLGKMASLTRHPLEYQGGLQQTLHMMNSPMVANVVNDTSQGILAAINAPYLSDSDRVEILFLATLGRPPTAAEQAWFAPSQESTAEDNHAPAALTDGLWALVNSAEFCLIR